MKLQEAANYIKDPKAPLPKLVASIQRILDFPRERANRLARYIVVTRAYGAGEPVSRIVSRFGCTRGTVLRYARMAGLPTRPKHFPADVRRAVIRDYKKRMPVATIARLHDVSMAYVSKLAREVGISRYRPSGKLRKLKIATAEHQLHQEQYRDQGHDNP